MTLYDANYYEKPLYDIEKTEKHSLYKHAIISTKKS